MPCWGNVRGTVPWTLTVWMDWPVSIVVINYLMRFLDVLVDPPSDHLIFVTDMSPHMEPSIWSLRLPVLEPSEFVRVIVVRSSI